MHRIDAAEFKNLSKLLLQRCPIGETPLLNVLFETRLATGIKWDPLFPLYIDCLCKMGQVQTSTVLHSLLEYSSIHDKPLSADSVTASGSKKPPKFYTFMTDIRIIQDAMLAISTGHAPKSFAEAVGILAAIVNWMQAVVAWHNNLLDASQQAEGLLSSPDAVSLFESLGILLAALSGTAKGLDVLSSNSHEGTYHKSLDSPGS